MQELLLAVARGLVEDKEAVKVTVDEPREDGTIVYHLSVAEGDMGRVIGKQGRIAKAIRVVMRAVLCGSMKRSLLRSTEHPTGPLPLRQGAFLIIGARLCSNIWKREKCYHPRRARRNEAGALVRRREFSQKGGQAVPLGTGRQGL